MTTAILTGEAGSVTWRVEFRQDGSADCRMKCVKNGAEAPELLDGVLSAFADVLKKRVPAETPPLENACVGEGLTGTFSLSCKDGGEPTESELAACQTAIGAAFAEFLETHPAEEKEITRNAILAARARNAARKVRTLMQKRPHPALDKQEREG
ncbi:MAG: hypothetical protein IJS01_15505 [Lentisphaeria bacterium]|nr:hypothetical protein [Lentisphaeria bacterium]